MTSKQTHPKHMEFEQNWHKFYEGLPPLGHVLRKKFYDSWVRFHALPKSKRYADTEAEREIILSRANSLAIEIFGASKTLWLVSMSTEGWSDEDEFIPRLKARHILNWTAQEDDWLAPDTYPFWGVKIVWKPKSIDWLFTCIADEISGALMFEPESGLVFAPYDGGFDIIGLEKKRIEFLETKYADWMSVLENRL